MTIYTHHTMHVSNKHLFDMIAQPCDKTTCPPDDYLIALLSTRQIYQHTMTFHDPISDDQGPKIYISSRRNITSNVDRHSNSLFY
jgi:hypothetical protein